MTLSPVKFIFSLNFHLFTVLACLLPHLSYNILPILRQTWPQTVWLTAHEGNVTGGRIGTVLSTRQQSIVKALAVFRCRTIFSSYFHPTYIFPLETSAHCKHTLPCYFSTQHKRKLKHFSEAVTDPSLLRRTASSELNNLSYRRGLPMLKDLSSCRDSMVLIKLRLQEQIEVIREVPFCSLTHMLNSLLASKWSNSQENCLLFAIVTFPSCGQGNRSSKWWCLLSVTTWERFVAALPL